MKKEELMKLDGMTDALAAAVLNLVKGDTEGMIPKARLDEVIAERDNARKEHADVLKELGALQKETGDAAELRDKIKSLEDAAKESQKKHDTEIHTLKVDNAVNAALLGSGALNVKAAKALLNLDKAELAEDGTVKGLADQIKALRTAEDSKFLFGSSTTKLKGAKAGESGNEDGDHQVDTSKMTYSELAAYMAEHPDEIFVEDDEEENDGNLGLFGEGDDPLYDKALEIVVQSGKASASYLQRRLKIGYNRAARLVEEMEERGIVGPQNGSKPREVIYVP